MCHSCLSRNPGSFCHPNPPHPAVPKAPPASPTRGEADYFIRLKYYKTGNIFAEGRDTFPLSPGGTVEREGEKISGKAPILSFCPLTRRYLRYRRPLPPGERRMKGADVSLLRKQQSRLLCTC